MRMYRKYGKKIAKKELKKRPRKLLLVLSFILILLLGVNFYLFTKCEESKDLIYIPPFGEIVQKNESIQPTIIKINYYCERDEDCMLASVNCCPETAGAYWECVGRNSTIICNPEGVICPQVISPRPEYVCRCVNNFCIPS
ncbi:MAG: hypothetical protein RMJ18_01805 [Candidatus Aenigmarchaeota archaeon]|nr:hypothetical protein [Candidatus Aenigmarchaeota archaeon]MDW8160132.1 hypothetical protein [Candidatus Aenigmarchaeota archaeon]